MRRDPDSEETALGEELPRWKPSSEVAQWFEGKSLEDLQVLEHGGRFFYPETLKRRLVKEGQHEEVAVRVRVPSTRDRAIARRDALQWAGELLGKQAPKALTIDAIRDRLGAIYWEHVDNCCLLSHCIFEPDEPLRRYALPDILDAHHPPAALYDLLERLDWWAAQEDPRVGELEEEAVVEVAAAVARRGHTGPLLAIDGRARESCITTMARLLTSSRTSKSSSPSPGTSTSS